MKYCLSIRHVSVFLVSLFFLSITAVNAADHQALDGYQLPDLSNWCSLRQKELSCASIHEQLALQGISGSAFWMGKVSAEGAFGEGDFKTAAHWYSVAAEDDHPKAIGELALLYYHGAGVEKDYQLAAELLRRSADRGEVEALWHLGRMYHFGRGVPQDHAQAFDYFKQAAEKGSAAAAHTLSFYYQNGIGIEVDKKSAMYWRYRAMFTQQNPTFG
ncbi:tetratricopeptide repeat protein [Corallincola platygyrae]|uniref:Tetratricopeptide repeat protein n=1 Tax=Corallincola platygyrae TaxID=1193278 RepID=A0ABW4XI87_9GAMM